MCGYVHISLKNNEVVICKQSIYFCGGVKFSAHLKVSGTNPFFWHFHAADIAFRVFLLDSAQ